MAINFCGLESRWLDAAERCQAVGSIRGALAEWEAREAAEGAGLGGRGRRAPVPGSDEAGPEGGQHGRQDGAPDRAGPGFRQARSAWPSWTRRRPRSRRTSTPGWCARAAAASGTTTRWASAGCVTWGSSRCPPTRSWPPWRTRTIRPCAQTFQSRGEVSSEVRRVEGRAGEVRRRDRALRDAAGPLGQPARLPADLLQPGRHVRRRRGLVPAEPEHRPPGAGERPGRLRRLRRGDGGPAASTTTTSWRAIRPRASGPAPTW